MTTARIATTTIESVRSIGGNSHDDCLRRLMSPSSGSKTNEPSLEASADAPREPIPIGSRRRRETSPPDLVEQAKARDQQAFEALYRLQFTGIARQVAALIRDPHRAEDVVAQTFLLAWRDLPKLRQPDRFDSWLARIAHNQAMSELRRRQTNPIEDAPDLEDPSALDRPDAALELGSNIEAARAALIELPEDQQQVLILRFIRDLPHAEVARILGRSEQATRALQYRALRAMEQLLATSDLTR